MNYQIESKYKDGRVIVKRYKRYKAAMDYFAKEVEVAETAYGVKHYLEIKFFVSGKCAMKFFGGKFIDWNLCPKCGIKQGDHGRSEVTQ